MNSLDHTLIRKAGYANGWENVRESTSECVVMFSARHKAEAIVTAATTGNGAWYVTFPKGPPPAELARSFTDVQIGTHVFHALGEAHLGKLLRRAAELAMSLPNQAAELYAAEVAKIEAEPLSATEVLRLVKQRIGQDVFRQALLDYWGGACAVTAIALPELLRASHAKPWADCNADAERLNVFNGFLLCAHLDALFDRGLMTFSDAGEAQFSSQIGQDIRTELNLSGEIRLRWVAADHLPFLHWHREKVFGD